MWNSRGPIAEVPSASLIRRRSRHVVVTSLASARECISAPIGSARTNAKTRHSPVAASRCLQTSDTSAPRRQGLGRRLAVALLLLFSGVASATACGSQTGHTRRGPCRTEQPSEPRHITNSDLNSVTCILCFAPGTHPGSHPGDCRRSPRVRHQQWGSGQMAELAATDGGVQPHPAGQGSLTPKTPNRDPRSLAPRVLRE